MSGDRAAKIAVDRPADTGRPNGHDGRRLVGHLHVDGSATRIVMGEDGHFHADVLVNGVKRKTLRTLVLEPARR